MNPVVQRQLDDLMLAIVHHRGPRFDWSPAKRRPAGIVALFTGPPGTGKTAAAETIAAKLGVDLQRVDVSAVRSKYIGETEKNLNRLFEQVEATGNLLFFDEADALFGNRSDVKDAHDRFANQEVAYLLQRMEQFAGVVILATNRKHHIDSAFTRRLRFIIDFPHEPADR